jgi:hypothetical protein
VKLTDAAPALKGMPPWAPALVGDSAMDRQTTATKQVTEPTLRMTARLSLHRPARPSR